MIIISNAGPLIALAKIKNFELLREIFGCIYIPQAVYNEVVVKGKGRAGADEVKKGYRRLDCGVPGERNSYGSKLSHQIGPRRI